MNTWLIKYTQTSGGVLSCTQMIVSDVNIIVESCGICIILVVKKRFYAE